MTFIDKVYTLRTKAHSEGETSYFISFTDGRGEFYDLEVSEAFYIEFRQMERKNRNLQQSDLRHQEASDLWDETLYKRASRVPKSVEKLIFDTEQRELLNKAIAALPEIQRRRFLLYHEYNFNDRQMGGMEDGRPQPIRRSVIRAKEKIQAVDLARARLKLLKDQYQHKQRDYQALREETLKVVQGTSHLNVDMLNILIDETNAQLKDLEQQISEAGRELQEMETSAEQIQNEYAQLMNWAELYDNCSFDAKKMIVAQFVKAVYVKKGFELAIEFNVSSDEFQILSLDAEAEDIGKEPVVLAYT